MYSKAVLFGVLAAVSLAACGGSTAASTQPSSTSQAPASAAPSAPAAAAQIGVASTKFGQVLVDGAGRTVYLFAADHGTTSVCYGACATAWPPVLTQGAPKAGAGVNASLLGTTARTDGTREVTYAGHPLYYFISDKKAGDVTGQAVSGFGGPWYVVTPSGAQVS